MLDTTRECWKALVSWPTVLTSSPGLALSWPHSALSHSLRTQSPEVRCQAAALQQVSSLLWSRDHSYNPSYQDPLTLNYNYDAVLRSPDSEYYLQTHHQHQHGRQWSHHARPWGMVPRPQQDAQVGWEKPSLDVRHLNSHSKEFLAKSKNFSSAQDFFPIKIKNGSLRK